MQESKIIVKERGIAMYPHEVRAILGERQTQFRRVVKHPPFDPCDEGLDVEFHTGHLKCPYGQPGDRLWVRETWGVGSRPHPFGDYEGIEYRADEAFLGKNDHLDCYKVTTPDDVCLCDYRSGWRPSIHMPRWASRITLEIADVRVERLHDISEDDAIAEGIQKNMTGCHWCGAPHKAHGAPRQHNTPVEAFSDLWDSINAKTYPWASNPWVWAVSFKRVV